MTEEASNQYPEQDQAQADYKRGQDLMKVNDLTQAANAFHNALIGFEQSGNRNGMANASDKLGDLCLKRGDFEAALLHYQRAYEFCEQEKDLFSILTLKRKLARVHRGRGDLGEAIAIHLELLDLFQEFKNPQRSVEILESLAELYAEQGQRTKAADAYRTAAAIHASFKHSRHAQTLQKKAAAIESE